MKTAKEVRTQVQELIGAKPDGVFGERDTWPLLRQLGVAAADSAWPPALAPKTGRDINAAGLELVRHFESLYLKAYKDTAGVWTIGWGHTGLQHKDGTVFPGREITEEKAEELLRYDMNQFEARVSSIIKVELNDDQFSALVSFDFNTGGLTLAGGNPSKLTRLLNAGDFANTANEFLRWDKVGGRTVRGLTRRRKSERRLFLSQHPAVIEA